MSAALYLALAYMRFHRWRTVALIVALALILAVPFATRVVLSAGEAALGARAEVTPLLLGARGGGTELVLNALYFTGAPVQSLPQAAEDAVWDSGLATAIPVHARLRARGHPVIGTTLDYFDFRRLDLAEGRGLGLLGEAVLGAGAAGALALGPGDTLITEPTTLFDLTGGYPLELSVVGVLAPARSPDDDAVFVDVRTAWVAEGIGHGHDDVTAGTAVGAKGRDLVASPAIRQFTRITPENIASFHFHGDTSAFPLSAVIAVPTDARAGTILEGRYLDSGSPIEAVRPAAVIDALLATLFRIGRVLDAVTLVSALAAALAVAVAVYLGLALRRDEIDTMTRLGARRLTMARMLAAEIGIMLAISAVLAATFLLPLAYRAESLALMLVSAPS